MAFDKSKVFHAVNAEEADKYIDKGGWFADSLSQLRVNFQAKNPSVLGEILDQGCEKRFKTSIYGFALFYPFLEPEYRPFKTCEEALPHMGRVMKSKTKEVYDIIRSVEQTDDGDIFINMATASWACANLVFADTGEPVGVRI